MIHMILPEKDCDDLNKQTILNLRNGTYLIKTEAGRTRWERAEKLCLTCQGLTDKNNTLNTRTPNYTHRCAFSLSAESARMLFLNFS